jgi:thiol:disulfide interchange protein
MDTFKHMMGFVLLGTVVFLLTFMQIPYVVPSVAFLIAIWAALWWVGRVPLTEPFQVRLRAWLAAGAFAALLGLLSFTWLLDIMESRFQRSVDRELATRAMQSGTPTPNVSSRSEAAATGTNVPPNGLPEGTGDASSELAWQPFSLSALEQHLQAGRTVFVDFTADW